MTCLNRNARYAGSKRTTFVLALTALVAVPTAAFAGSSAGDLDPSFGRGGKVLTKVADAAHSVDIGLRGRIVVAGGQPFAVARYRQRGHLDDSFSQNGKVKTDFGAARSSAKAVAITLPVAPGLGGKVVAAGQVTLRPSEKPSRFAIARYKADGRLDDSFSDNGKLKLNLGHGDRRESAHAVAIDSKGRIIVAGQAPNREGRLLGVIARLRPDGHLDRSFGGDGKVRLGQTTGILSLGIDEHRRRILALGGNAVFRLKPDGSKDRSFGDDGRASVRRVPRALAIDQGDRIVIAGKSKSRGNRVSGFLLQRLTHDGRPDDAFGGDGEVVTDFAGPSEAVAVAVDSRRRIVAFGRTSVLRHLPEGPERRDRLALARYLHRGNLDVSFGEGGKVRTAFTGDFLPGGVAIDQDKDDRILGVGGAGQRFALARFLG